MVNFSTLFGFAFAVLVMVLSVVHSIDDSTMFLSMEAFIIVIGGTFAATFISFPLGKIYMLVKIFFKRVLGLTKRDYPALIRELEGLNNAYLQGKRNFEAVLPSIKDPFLLDAANVLFWLEADVDRGHLRELLEQRADTMLERYMQDAKIFHTISKFPPAFGLIGTTLGMIALLKSLTGDAADNIGPAMAIALVATLYGVTISNMFLVPVAENLKQQTFEDDVARRLIVEGIMLIEEKMPTKFVVEKLKSYLLPSQRGNGAKPASSTR